jgi:hypothetical protein
LIDPEDDGCGNADGGHDGARALVVAGMDASPIREPGEHVLDSAALAIEHGIVCYRDLSVPL